MSKISSKLNIKNLSLKSIVGAIIVIILAITGGYSLGMTVSPEGDITLETNYAMELSEEQVPTMIETAEGEIEVTQAPTVEEVDGGKIEECPEGEECGMGAYVYVDVTSPQTIRESLEGDCVNVDNFAGSQCYDTSAAVSENMTGRRLTTCGTGAASGMMDCWEQNAGNDFYVAWDSAEIIPGAIVQFKGGQYGHTGIAMGYPHDGYVALLSTNQGGKACPGGGSSANIINISLKNFIGAYIWKEYLKDDEPSEPELPLPVSNCVKWHVERGDTMSKIMLECENTVVYGEAMNAYAKTWYSLIYKPGQSVYDGWHSKSGVGLYAGDDIEHRTE